MIAHALILAAGLGTRLRPLTDERAKPAMPVAGEPLIRRIISWLAAAGAADIVVNLHHRPETVTAVVGDGGDLGARVRYSWEQPRVLGSAGGPRQALPLLGAERFLLVNGDTLTDVDLGSIVRAHVDAQALVTLALVPNREFERYGGVNVDAADRVIGFSRRGPDSRGSWHFVGVQVVEASVFASLSPGEPLSTIGGIYDDLIRTRPAAIHAFRCDAAFWDVGTAGDYLRTSHAFTKGRPDIGRNVRVDRTATIDGSILWDDVEVGAGAALEECIVADGVSVEAGARYSRSILIRRDGQLTITPIHN